MRCRGSSTEGVALLEAALVLPFLVVMMLNVANFGIYIYGWVTVDNAARALLEYRVYTGVVLGYPPSASVTQMGNLVTTEVSSLPAARFTNVTWEICSNANGVYPACQGTGAAFTPDPDPQAAQYALYSAKVSCTFHSLFPPVTLPLGYSAYSAFPNAGSVSRQVSMRSMQ